MKIKCVYKFYMVTLKRNVNGMTLLMPHGRKKRIRKKFGRGEISLWHDFETWQMK